MVVVFPEQEAARGRLIFSYSQHLRNENELNEYLDDLCSFISVSNGMIAQAISSYHKPRGKIEMDKESNQLDDNAGAPEHPVKNPYAETQESKWRKLMSKEGCQRSP